MANSFFLAVMFLFLLRSRAQPRRFRRIDDAGCVHGHAIMCTRGWNCHLSIPDVLTDGLGRPLVWIAVAAATGLMMREKLASSHVIVVTLPGSERAASPSPSQFPEAPPGLPPSRP
jgi:hypothetical protein